MLGKYSPRENSNTQNAQNLTDCQSLSTITSRLDADIDSASWTRYDECVVEFTPRVRPSKHNDPIVRAHMKLANMVPKGSLP